MALNKNSIGVIGGGFVGSILKRYYPQAKVCDIKGGFDSWDEVRKSEIIFLAVNLLDNCASEDSKSKLNNYFAEMDKGTVVIIKSTLIPGTLDYFQEKFPHIRLIYNPEFLTEMTAWEDFSKPQFQILGVPHQSLNLVHEIFSILPEAPINRVISPKDAEVLKHSFNAYYALKVAWFNQLYDACQELGTDYETVREIMVRNVWIGDSHSVIFHKGYRGYGTIKESKCLPKDLQAFKKVAKMSLLDTADEYNNKLISMRGVQETKKKEV